MIKVYVYILDTLADWEIGFITAELNSRRFFKKDTMALEFKTVSISKEPIKTMGGMTIIPDCLIEDIAVSKTSTLLLPGANTWSDPKHSAIIEKAKALLSSGGTVCAICGATVALANVGLLDNRPHTSNGAGFLEMMSPAYNGKDFFKDEPSITDGNLITAGCTGALQWTKQIIERLDVFSADTLIAWYDYFRTGSAESFFALMQTLPASNY